MKIIEDLKNDDVYNRILAKFDIDGPFTFEKDYHNEEEIIFFNRDGKFYDRNAFVKKINENIINKNKSKQKVKMA